MDKFLAHLGRVVIGVILGVFILGIPSSVVFGPTSQVGIYTGAIGVFSYYLYLLFKGKKNVEKDKEG